MQQVQSSLTPLESGSPRPPVLDIFDEVERDDFILYAFQKSIVVATISDHVITS